MRAESVVKALLGGVGRKGGSGGAVGEGGKGEGDVSLRGTREEGGDGNEAAGVTGDILAFMREWWPKVVLAAVDSREWGFLSR